MCRCCRSCTLKFRLDLPWRQAAGILRHIGLLLCLWTELVAAPCRPRPTQHGWGPGHIPQKSLATWRRSCAASAQSMGPPQGAPGESAGWTSQRCATPPGGPVDWILYIHARGWIMNERDTILNCFLPTGLSEGSASSMPCRSVLAPTGLSALWVRDFSALELDMRRSPRSLVMAAG